MSELRKISREELAEILEAHKKWLICEEGGKLADLRWADLRWAKLSRADLDYSCWPLWCGGLHVKTDRRIMAQLAYHFCNQECDDPDYINARNAILDFANTFHRVDECGKLERIEPNSI